MRKAILNSFISVLVLALLLSGTIFIFVFSNILLSNTRTQLMVTLKLLDGIHFEEQQNMLSPQIEELLKERSSRLTIVNADGTVMLDTGVEDTSSLQNHLERKEIRDAFENGSGYSIRVSDTLNIRMLYVALLSQSKTAVYRVAVPYAGLTQYLPSLLPALIFSLSISFAVSGWIAKKLADSITEPLEEIALEMERLKETAGKLKFGEYDYSELQSIANTAGKMAEDLDEFVTRLEKEKKVRQEFFSNASHELKTPLTSVRGYAELLCGDLQFDEKSKREFLLRMLKEIDAMTHLIDDILMISKLETNELSVMMTAVSIREVIDETVLECKPLADSMHVKVSVDCPDLQIYASLQQMEELFRNLISNAIKYNKTDGFVWIEARKQAGELIFSVEDTGIGISEEDQEHIFERFYRSDKGRSKKRTGTGLGLSIVKHIVNYYHGTITVISRLNVGTRFTVRLPDAIWAKDCEKM